MQRRAGKLFCRRLRMSIIYDALKKLQGQPKKPEEAATPAVKTKTNPKLIILYAVVATLGLIAGNIFFNFLTRSKAPLLAENKTIPAAVNTTTPKLQPQIPKRIGKPENLMEKATSMIKLVGPAKEVQTQSLTLNGIFSSGTESYALINNEICRVGDVVEGAKIKKINADNIILDKSGETIKLSTRTK